MTKSPCPSCHGITFDDSRGNCGACGAPRNHLPALTPEEKRRNELLARTFGHALTPQTAEGLNRSAQDLRRAMDDLSERVESQSIRFGDELMPTVSRWIDALKISS